MTANRILFDPSFPPTSWNLRLQKHHNNRYIHVDLHDAHLHQFLPDARRFRIHELPVDDGGAGKTDAVNPDNLQGSLGYPSGCQFACHSLRRELARKLRPTIRIKDRIPSLAQPQTRVQADIARDFSFHAWGPTPTSFCKRHDQHINGKNGVNWSNTPVTNCPTPGATSCIQLRADAVGYAVNELLATAAASEQAAGITNQYEVGLYPVHRQTLFLFSANLRP